MKLITWIAAVPLVVGLGCERKIILPEPGGAPVYSPPSSIVPGAPPSYYWIDPVGGSVPIPEEYVYVNSNGVAVDERTGHELRRLERQNRTLTRELEAEQKKAAEQKVRDEHHLEKDEQKAERVEAKERAEIEREQAKARAEEHR
ncbi:MAG: hypothetical protein U0610_26055 [bacterium]